MPFLPVYPKKVELQFQARRCGGTPVGDTTPVIYAVSTDNTYSGAEIGVETFKDTALALFNPNTTSPTNLSQLQALCGQFTADYLAWRQNQYDYVYNSIAAIQPQGINDIIEWEINVDDCTTRVSTFPPFQTIRELGHQIPTPDSSCADEDDQHVSTNLPCVKLYSNPVANQTTGETTLDEWLICLIDGRLTQTFVGTVTYPCTCGSTGPGPPLGICANCGVTSNTMTLDVQLLSGAHVIIPLTFEPTALQPGWYGPYDNSGTQNWAGVFCVGPTSNPFELAFYGADPRHAIVGALCTESTTVVTTFTCNPLLMFWDSTIIFNPPHVCVISITGGTPVSYQVTAP